MKHYFARVTLLLVGLLGGSSLGYSAECDSVLVDSGLSNSDASAVNVALQLVSKEDFQRLKAQFGPQLPPPLSTATTFEDFSEARNLLSRKLTFAYGLDSARASLLTSVDAIQAWDSCMRRQGPGLHAWLSAISSTQVTISILWNSPTPPTNEVSIRKLSDSTYAPQTISLGSGEVRSLNVPRPDLMEAAFLVASRTSDSTGVTVVVPAKSNVQGVIGPSTSTFESRYKRSEVISVLGSQAGRIQTSCMFPDDGWRFSAETPRIGFSSGGDEYSTAGVATIVEHTPGRICFQVVARSNSIETSRPVSAYVEATEIRAMTPASFQLCVGEPASLACQNTLSCGSSAEEWAAQKCRAPFVKNQIAGTAGGKCGYSVFQIQCLPPVAYFHAVTEPYRSAVQSQLRVADIVRSYGVRPGGFDTDADPAGGIGVDYFYDDDSPLAEQIANAIGKFIGNDQFRARKQSSKLNQRGVLGIWLP